MKKKKLLLAITAISALTLAACQSDDSTKDAEDSALSIAKDITNAKKSEVILEVDGSAITAGEIQNKMDDNILEIYTKILIKEKFIIAKFPSTEEEIREKATARGLNYDDLNEVEKKEIEYETSYLKGIASVHTVTDEELKSVYDKFFADSGTTFEDIKEDIRDITLQEFGFEKFENQLNENLKEAKVEFKNKDLETIYKKSQE